MRRTFQLGFACVAILCAAARMACAGLVAYDSAGLDDPYLNENTFMSGQNGGAGFGAWEFLSGSEGSTFLAGGIDGESTHSWGLAGPYALGRGLAEARDSFVWSFLAVHNAAGSFSGFNLKTIAGEGFAGGEVLRFGMDPDNDSNIAVSIDQGDTYDSFDGGWFNGIGDTLLYTVAWNNGAYAIGVSNLTQEIGAQFFGAAASGAIAQFGVAVEGGLDDRLLFDQFVVTPIPEPATAACMALGACLLLKARRRRS